MEIATYFDRMIATLVRGGDLSTISRNDAHGSSVQGDETDALLQDDCALVSETLQTQLDRLVIRMVHGDETPAAYVVIEPPSDTDQTKELAIDEGLARLGVKQDPEDLAERYGREVGEDAEVRGQGSGASEEEDLNRKAAEAAEEDAEKMKVAENYDPMQPRNPRGEWTDGQGGGGGLSLSRSRRKITFQNPIKTPLGEVVGYEWQHKTIEVDSGGDEGIVLKKVSDWDKATTNAETGRDIVHQFALREPDGTVRAVSMESLVKTAGPQGKEIKGLVQAARALPIKEAELADLKSRIDEYSKRFQAEERRVSYLTPPQPSWRESDWPAVKARGQANMYVGDVFVSVEDKSKPFPYDRIEYGRNAWKSSQMQIGMKQPDFDRVDVLKRSIRKSREKLAAAGVLLDQAGLAENYSYAQPRIPKGMGDPSGEWTDEPEFGGNGVPHQVERKLKKKQDSAIDNWETPEEPPSTAELMSRAEEAAEAAKNAPDLEAARKEYEQEQLEAAMEGFPEIGKEMKGQLPRPEDMDPADPLKAEVQMVWDRFQRETRRRDSSGDKVIMAAGAAQYFAPKGTSKNLDELRGEMNELGFEFQTPGEMIHAVYESLEGRKSWGTASRGDFAANELDALRAALSADLQPLGEALAGAMQAGDEAAMRGALKKISARMPEFLNSPELEALMATEFTQALTQEDDDV
jgi:hypothetical protein